MISAMVKSRWLILGLLVLSIALAAAVGAWASGPPADKFADLCACSPALT